MVVLAHIRQRANLAARNAGHANLAAMTNKVDVERIVAVGRNELAENLVSFFIRGVFGNPAEALGHAKDVRIDWERGRGTTSIYEIWLICS